MSRLGMAEEVYGVIENIIETVKASIEAYEAVQNKSVIPETVRIVSERLPSLLEVLQNTGARYSDRRPDKSRLIAAEATIKTLKGSCQNLQNLLKSAYSQSDASTLGRVFESESEFSDDRSSRADHVLAEIYDFLQLLVAYRFITETEALGAIRKTVHELFSRSTTTQRTLDGTYTTNIQSVEYNTNFGDLPTERPRSLQEYSPGSWYGKDDGLAAKGLGSPKQQNYNKPGLLRAASATALHDAIRQCNLSLAKTILQEDKPDLEVATPAGETPLLLAARSRYYVIVELLLNQGANINAHTHEWITALHESAELGDIDTVKLLLRRGANASAINNMGETPLFGATRGDRCDVVELLLDKGSDLMVRNFHYHSVLHVAATKSYYEVLEVMLKHCLNRIDTGDTAYRSSGITDTSSQRGHVVVPQPRGVDIGTGLGRGLHFDGLVTGICSWLGELRDLGYNHKEIAAVLVEERRDAPWVSVEQRLPPNDIGPSRGFHIPYCVHSGNDTSHMAAGRILLEANEANNFRRTVAAMCGLAGAMPMHYSLGLCEDLVSFSNTTATVDFAAFNPDGLFVLERIKTAIKSVCRAIAYLQGLSGCCDAFSVVWKTSDMAALQLVTINVGDVLNLSDAISSASLYNTSSLEQCMRAAEVILAPEPTTRSFMESVVYIRHVDKLHICALATQFLCLAFLSYCQAHLGPLHPFFLEHELLQVRLNGTASMGKGPCITVDFRRLTCLESVLHGPLIVFSMSEDPVQAGPILERFDMLAKANDMIDTWGPGAIMQDPRSSRCLGIAIRDTMIHRVGSHKYHCGRAPNFRADGVYLSWNRDTRILIGARLDKNAKCVPVEAEYLIRCQGYCSPIGTKRSRFTLEQREVGFQGGQYFMATSNLVFRKTPPGLLKQRYLDDLSQRKNFRATLESRCGIQVSICSGLAKRTRMRDIVAEMLPIFAKRELPRPAYWAKLRDYYKILDHLSSGNLSAVLDRMSEDDVQCYESLQDLVSSIMESLRDTGLNQAGDSFGVAFVPSVPSEWIRRVDFDVQRKNYWTKALRDTDMCATFAYFTKACYEIEDHGCRGSEKIWHGQILILETEVFQHFGGHSTLTNSVTGELKHDVVYQLGRPDADVALMLRATIVRPRPTEDPRLLIGPLSTPASILYRLAAKLQRHQHLQEKLGSSETAQKVFMTSSDCDGFSFKASGCPAVSSHSALSLGQTASASRRRLWAPGHIRF